MLNIYWSVVYMQEIAIYKLFLFLFCFYILLQVFTLVNIVEGALNPKSIKSLASMFEKFSFILWHCVCQLSRKKSYRRFLVKLFFIVLSCFYNHNEKSTKLFPKNICEDFFSWKSAHFMAKYIQKSPKK